MANTMSLTPAQLAGEQVAHTINCEDQISKLSTEDQATAAKIMADHQRGAMRNRKAHKAAVAKHRVATIALNAKIANS